MCLHLFYIIRLNLEIGRIKVEKLKKFLAIHSISMIKIRYLKDIVCKTWIVLNAICKMSHENLNSNFESF